MNKRDDLFIDDSTIPQEMLVYYSKTSNYTEVVIMLLLLTSGLYMLFKTTEVAAGLLVITVTIFYGYRSISKARNKTPQIIMNDRGLQTATTKFYSWSEINNARVVKEGFDTSISFYLTYNYPKGSERLEITDLTTDRNELERAMGIYRARHTNKQEAKEYDK